MSERPEILPWLVEGNPWKTEGKWLNWLRGVLRKGWSNYAIKTNYKNSKKYKVKNTNPKSMKRFPEINKIDCEICKKQFPFDRSVEVDHIGDEGTLKCIGDIEGYAKHLYYVDEKWMRIACKECHYIITHAQSRGITFEEAELEKYVINLLRVETKSDIILFIESWQGVFNNEEYLTGNEAQRRKALVEIFKYITKGD